MTPHTAHSRQTRTQEEPMNTLLEQATPQYEVPTHLLEVVGKALYGWGDDEPNEATGYTAVYESVQVAAAVHAAGYRLNAYEPLVKALREVLSEWDDWYLDGARQDDARFYRVKDAVIAASEALATVTESDSGTLVESSPEREGGE